MCFYHMTERNSTVYSLNLDTNRKQQTLIQIRIFLVYSSFSAVYPGLSLAGGANPIENKANLLC